jgi:prepilin-type N-terminal cleavage/methylation domain-containing protein
MNIYRNKKRGFTLMETMIYIALFGVIMTGALVGTYNLLEGGRRNIDTAKIEEEGTFLNRKINWALTGASNVVVSGGGTKMTITRPDLGAQSPIVISQSGNNMTITRGAGSEVELQNNRFNISGTFFVYTPASGSRPPSISATFKVAEKTFNFRNYLRQ